VTAASSEHPWALLITRDKVVAFTSVSEKDRLADEILDTVQVPVESKVLDWDGCSIREALQHEVSERTVLVDMPWAKDQVPLGDMVYELLYPLTDAQVREVRRLGNDVRYIVEQAAKSIKPGVAERMVAGRIASGMWDVGIFPAVLLVGADERAIRYRHPVPTSQPIQRYALVAAVGRRKGLHVCITRLIHIGKVPSELKRYHRACATIEACLMASTRPGTTYSQIVDIARQLYAEQGFPDEVSKHHQGGPTGYVLTDIESTKRGMTVPVSDTHVVSWNPTVHGAKSEDTFVVWGNGFEVVTSGEDWPTITVSVRPISPAARYDRENQTAEVTRPDILVL